MGAANRAAQDDWLAGGNRAVGGRHTQPIFRRSTGRTWWKPVSRGSGSGSLVVGFTRPVRPRDHDFFDLARSRVFVGYVGIGPTTVDSCSRSRNYGSSQLVHPTSRVDNGRSEVDLKLANPPLC